MDSRHTSPDRLVHQAIHGYGHGHELLASSEDFDDETASILSHNSDSASTSRVTDGQYLTGYAIPGGRYVISRTWSDTEAERPNTVVTRSLLLPAETPPGFDPQRVLDLLERPIQPRLAGGLPPLDIAQFVGGTLRLTPDEAAIAVRFYGSQTELSHPDSLGRERIAIAIWKQLWRSARHGLVFCTAPDSDRFARHPRALRFERDGATDCPVVALSSTAEVIVTDLRLPGQFRRFVHFVASGEKAPGLMVTFAEAFEILNAPLAPVGELTNLLKTYRGIEPRRLRRMKRQFLSFQRHAPRWDVDPFDLLHALARDDLGKAVYASDASLDQWLRYCWDIDPRKTAQLLPNPDPERVEIPTGPPTAREGLAAAFTTQAPQLITPATLAIAAEFNPSAALATVWEHNDGALWRAWSALDRRLGVPGGDCPSQGYDWAVSLEATRDHPEALSAILRRHPEALDTLIALADTAPSESDHLLDLTSDAKRYLRNRLETSTDQLEGLTRLSDADTLPGRLNVAAWVPVVLRSTDEAVSATAFLISKEAGAEAWEIATLSTAALHHMLSTSEASNAWDRINRHIRGDRNSWDRCGRLVDEFSRLVRHYPDDVTAKAVALLRRRDTAAAKALEARLRAQASKSKNKFRFFDPSTW
jgi:hypothetical protein